jgi:hypothetical protein
MAANKLTDNGKVEYATVLERQGFVHTVCAALNNGASNEN